MTHCRLRPTTSARIMDGCYLLSTRGCTTQSLGIVPVATAVQSDQLLSCATQHGGGRVVPVLEEVWDPFLCLQSSELFLK